MKKQVGFWVVILLLLGLAVFVSCVPEKLVENEPQEQIVDINQLKGSGATNLCYTETSSAWQFSSGACGVWTPETSIVYMSCGDAALWCQAQQKSLETIKYNISAVSEISENARKEKERKIKQTTNNFYKK